MGGATELTTLVWYDAAPRPGWEQMAIDHALRDRAEADGTAVLRLYQWSHDTISFGANEAATRHWDRSAIERQLHPVVRRPSGGRAVWHDRQDLTYAFTGPFAPLGGVRAAYGSIHRILATALERLGLWATLAPPPPRLPGLRRGACFDVAVGGEVMLGSTKVIGSAQVVTRTALLQHGAIARADRSEQLAGFRRDETRRAAEGTTPALPTLPATARIAAAIEMEWLARGARPMTAGLTAWANAASVKHVERYRDPGWTWRR